MRILVTGASGRLGSRLVEVLSARKHNVIGYNSKQLDVTDFDATGIRVAELQPDIVIHAAAWTDVEGCAREPDRAVAVNGFGTQHIALAAARIGAAILYVSSNEVFDGQRETPYQEYDRPNPINLYGFSKWVGEQVTVHTNPKHYVVRTSWLFAPHGKNFLHNIGSAVQAGKPLRVVTDEIANPTFSYDLADAIVQLVETERYGIYHFVNEGACSRYEFARYFLDKLGHHHVPIEPISQNDWARASTPPAMTSLKNLAGLQVGIRLRPWQEAVDAFLQVIQTPL